jgi:mannose/cellobiose epimerase-like protein (N-acyl-D-glucosamine 2-epimerase family)
MEVKLRAAGEPEALQAAAPEVPAGWKLVPLDPTDAMLAAADGEWKKGCMDPTMHVWDAMLAAAPSQDPIRAALEYALRLAEAL